MHHIYICRVIGDLYKMQMQFCGLVFGTSNQTQLDWSQSHLKPLGVLEVRSCTVRLAQRILADHL